MKKHISFFLCLCLVFSLCACGNTARSVKKGTRLFTDSCGREVEIPVEIDSIVPSGPLAQMILYTVCPDKLQSLSSALTRTQKKYLDKSLWDLPVTGQFYGGAASVNYEEIIASAPDIIIDMGEYMDTIVEDMDALQAQTQTPVIFIEASLDAIARAYDLLGEVTGDVEQAEACAAYIRETLTDIAERAARIPESERLRTIYAMGEYGNEVYGRGSIHAETLDYVGAENIAVVERYNAQGRTEVPMETMLLWNPDVLILGPDSNYREIWTDLMWANVSAVKSGRVYEIPLGPYNWLDQPPSVQRILGLKWLGNVLYPELYNYDMIDETRKFYALFWHYEVSETEARELMENSIYKDG